MSTVYETKKLGEAQTLVKEENSSVAKKNVKVPTFFSLEKDGKTSFLLGTNHIIPLNELPEGCLQIIKSCATFVTEESDEDANEFYCKAVMRDTNSKSWVDDLPSEVTKSLAFAVEKCFEDFHPLYKRKLNELNLWAAYLFAGQGYRKLLNFSSSHNSTAVDKVEGEAEIETSEIETTGLKETEIDPSENQNAKPETVEQHLGMDHELILKLFPEKTFGLEGLLDKIPMHQKEANSLDKLVELYKAYTGDNHNEADEVQDEDNDVATELQKCMEFYRYGFHLDDLNCAIEQNEDQETIERNLKWLPNFIKHHQTLTGPVLFGVGVRHLIGEKGLLTLLANTGFKIKYFIQDKGFQDYSYPFTEGYLVKACLDPTGVSTHNYTTALLHYFAKFSSEEVDIVHDYLDTNNVRKKALNV